MPVQELEELIEAWLKATADLRAAETARQAAYQADEEAMKHFTVVSEALYKRLVGRGAVLHRGHVILATEKAGVQRHTILS